MWLWIAITQMARTDQFHLRLQIVTIEIIALTLRASKEESNIILPFHFSTTVLSTASQGKGKGQRQEWWMFDLSFPPGLLNVRYILFYSWSYSSSLALQAYFRGRNIGLQSYSTAPASHSTNLWPQRCRLQGFSEIIFRWLCSFIVIYMSMVLWNFSW